MKAENDALSLEGGDCVSEDEGYDLENLRELRALMDQKEAELDELQAELEESDEDDAEDLEQQIAELDDEIEELNEMLCDAVEDFANELREIAPH